MNKRKSQKKSSNPEQENKRLEKTPDVKADRRENDSEAVNDVPSDVQPVGTTTLTRRQKKNLKQHEKKLLQLEGGNQAVTTEQSSPKKKELRKDEGPVEKPPVDEENNKNEAWKSVERSSNKPKNVENNRVQQNLEPTIVEVNRHKQKKNQNSDKIPVPLKEDKATFDYFSNEVIKDMSTNNTFKSNDKKKESPKPKNEDNDGAKITVNVSKEHTDKDFDKFNAMYKEKRFTFVKVKEIQEDLFSSPPTYSLAHCVAEDMTMGSGIAVQFSQKFKRRDELYQQRQKQGGLAVLEDNGRYIYYLVTKKLSNGKPTTYTMWNSLQKLQQHIQKNKVRNLAIPRIGCGLDRLEWSEIKAMIEYTFRDVDTEITVCNFQQQEEDTSRGSNLPPAKQLKCPVRNVRYPLVDIESGTAIIYFGTVNGYTSEDIQSLDNKFRILRDYIGANRKLGDVIQAYKNQQEFSLLGCITRNTEKDPFDFCSFQKCIVQIKKLNKNYYSYVGIQAFLDDHDDLLLSKITNMLRYSLIKVEVYVCWGGNMAEFMPPERGDF